MTNARHAGITPFVLNELNRERGVMILAKPSHMSLKGALNELGKHYPDQTPIVTRQRITDRCVTPYAFGQSLLSAAYDLQVTPNDAAVVATMRQLVTDHGVPIHPDTLLGLWKEETSVPSSVARAHGLSQTQVDRTNEVFAALDQAEERAFQSSGTVSMTGLLSLPAAVALTGPRTIITCSTSDLPLGSRSRILLTSAASERLLIVTDTPALPEWHVQFQHARA